MGCLNVVVTQVNAPTIAVSFTRIGGCSAAVTDANDPVTVNVWLICSVSQTELYEFLMVQEGELISIQDGYIKVLRNEL